MAPLVKRSHTLTLQKRDIALLHDLLESRVMTSAHLTALHFDGKKEAAKKRIQKLKTASLIGERARRVNEPSVLFLRRQAFSILAKEGVLSKYPTLPLSSLEKRAQIREFTLRHELEVMDVKVAFHSALQQAHPFSLEEFTTWPLLNQFEACPNGYDGRSITVKPDGFIRIDEQEPDGGASEHVFFVEVDRSSEVVDTLVSKAICYLDYLKSGGFAVRNGAPRSACKEYPFRVVMVFKSAERRNNVAERLVQNTPPVYTHACLTTFEEVVTNPLGPIWVQPIDYRDATQGTEFDPDRRRNAWGYKTQTARELFVEKHVKRIRLLAEDTTTADSMTPQQTEPSPDLEGV